MAARSPFPRRSLRSLPPSPSRASPPAGKAYPRAGEGGALSASAAPTACGRRNQRLCGRHRRALSWGAPAPMPPEAACGRVGAPLARIAPPTHGGAATAQARRRCRAQRVAIAASLSLFMRPAPAFKPPPAGGSAARGIRAPAAWAASAHLRCRAPRLGTSSRGSSGSRVACSGRIVGPGVAARLSPAQLAGPAGFPFLLHFFAFQLANVCSIWYNCIGRFCL